MHAIIKRIKPPVPQHVHTVVSRGREYFYFQIGRGRSAQGPRIRLNDPWSIEELERARLASAELAWSKTFKSALQGAKARSTKLSVPFYLDLDFLSVLMKRQSFKCAVSGIAFEHDGFDDCQARPFSPSIDRIDPAHGYAKDNVRFVCCIANAAMGEWGLAALERLAIEIVRNKSEPNL